ncbi:hypothetical protein J6590_067467 [Homalodisca vitripennis]|nr:hypothetical protein J6590_067467 [Homalodisca vitripennis]
MLNKKLQFSSHYLFNTFVVAVSCQPTHQLIMSMHQELESPSTSCELKTFELNYQNKLNNLGLTMNTNMKWAGQVTITCSSVITGIEVLKRFPLHLLFNVKVITFQAYRLWNTLPDDIVLRIVLTSGRGSGTCCWGPVGLRAVVVGQCVRMMIERRKDVSVSFLTDLRWIVRMPAILACLVFRYFTAALIT